MTILAYILWSVLILTYLITTHRQRKQLKAVKKEIVSAMQKTLHQNRLITQNIIANALQASATNDKRKSTPGRMMRELRRLNAETVDTLNTDNANNTAETADVS